MSVSSTNRQPLLTASAGASDPDSPARDPHSLNNAGVPAPHNGNAGSPATLHPHADSAGVPTAESFTHTRHSARNVDPPDEKLLAGYRSGDRKSFSQLVERYQRELFHFLVRFLGDRAAAEDIFQETFLQVHQSADQFDPTRRFRPWLFTIAANKARDLMRSNARRPTSPLQAQMGGSDEEGGQFIDLMEAAQPMPGESMEREELQQLVQSTVESMPDHLREILLLSYFHQFPYKEISDILQIPLGTVKSRLHASVAHFADRWKNRQQRTSGG